MQKKALGIAERELRCLRPEGFLNENRTPPGTAEPSGPRTAAASQGRAQRTCCATGKERGALRAPAAARMIWNLKTQRAEPTVQ